MVQNARIRVTKKTETMFNDDGGKESALVSAVILRIIVNLKEFADDNFKIDEYSRKFSKPVKKNTVGKGEIALYEQFLLFPQGFQKTCTADM